MNIDWNKVFTRRFAAIVVALLLAAVGLRAGVAAMGWVLLKKPLPLRQPLDAISEVLAGPAASTAFDAADPAALAETAIVADRYRLVKREPRMPKDAEDMLGTDKYITWVYHDTSRSPNEAGAFIRMHLPYYTGTIETVPHVPDRCLVETGQVVGKKTFPTVQLHPATYRPAEQRPGVAMTKVDGQTVHAPGASVPMTMLEFAKTERMPHPFCVTYFFIANGQFVADPEGVRLKAFDLANEYAYFAKVELMPVMRIQLRDRYGKPKTNDAGEPLYGYIPYADGPEQALSAVSDFLSAALPEIMACLPDMHEVEQNGAPAAGTGPVGPRPASATPTERRDEVIDPESSPWPDV